MTGERRRAVLVLVLAVAGVSIAAPLIRLSEAHPMAIAIWRLAIALLVILPFLARERGWTQWRQLSGIELRLGAGAGVMLALHFWAWNTSIGFTSIAASVVLVNVQPVLVAIISAVWLREAPVPLQWAGIALAMTGAVVIGLAGAGPDSPAPHTALGNGLALIGALTAALYYLVGRRLRQTLDLWPYVTLVYGVALITLLMLAGAARVPVGGQPLRELAIFAGLALGPMLLGHTGFNWALRYLPAYVVSLAVLGEPVGATILAAVIPGIREIPPPLTIGGGILVLAGIALALPRPRTESGMTNA